MRDGTRLHVFDIELLCDQEVYHLGESISGAIVIEPAQGQIISKLRVGIHAVAKVAWTMGSGHNSTTHSPDNGKHVQHAVHYFDAERSIYENRRASAPSGPDLMKLRVTSRLGLLGPEEFPFVFKLPERGAPPSWTGLYGSVRYWIEAVVEVGGKDCFREDVQQGIIIAPSSTSLPDPQLQAQKFQISGLTCLPTSLSASVKPDRAAYLPGDTIQLAISIKNASPWKVSPAVSLINTQVFIGKTGVQKLIKDALVQTSGDEPVRAHSDGGWTSSLTIPSTVCVSLLDCVIIKCHYTALLRLRVRSVIPQFYDIAVPIIVVKRETIGSSSDEIATTSKTAAAGRLSDLKDRATFREEFAFSEAAETASVTSAPLFPSGAVSSGH